MKTKRAAVNTLVSLVTQAITLLLNVVTRTVFLAYFTIELLGVSTLISSSVALVGVADLGVNTAIMFALYRPLATNDTHQIAAIVAYSRKIFAFVALTVGAVGLLAIPLLPVISKASVGTQELVLYYLIVLASSVASYLMADRQVLLLADQRLDVIKWANFITALLKSVLQIVAIVVFHSFLVFLIVQSVAVVIGNLLAYLYANSHYRYIAGRQPLLSAESRQDIATSVRAMLIYRTGGLLLNNTDPIIISAIVGTLALGYYSNYMLIVGSALLFTELIFASLAAGVGHVVSEGNSEKSLNLFKEVALLAVVIYSTISAILLATTQDFLTLWLGSKYTLSDLVLCLIVANFLLYGLLSPVMVYRTATGLFRDTRYLLLVTAFINVVLSIALGYFYGIAGILFATLVARVSTNFWVEPWLLFKNYLHGRLVDIFLIQIFGVAVVGTAYVVVTVMPFEEHLSLLPKILVDCALSTALCLGLVWLVWRRTSTGMALKSRVLTLVNR